MLCVSAFSSQLNMEPMAHFRFHVFLFPSDFLKSLGPVSGGAPDSHGPCPTICCSFSYRFRMSDRWRGGGGGSGAGPQFGYHFCPHFHFFVFPVVRAPSSRRAHRRIWSHKLVVKLQGWPAENQRWSCSGRYFGQLLCL